MSPWLHILVLTVFLSAGHGFQSSLSCVVLCLYCHLKRTHHLSPICTNKTTIFHLGYNHHERVTGLSYEL